MKNPFANSSTNNDIAYYDLFDDMDLIETSLMQTYHIRMRGEEFKKLSWKEYMNLLRGVGKESELVDEIRIRSEEDREILKHFSKEQRKRRNEWRNKQAKKITKEEMNKIMENMGDTLFRNF